MERIDTGTGGRHGIFKRADACETDKLGITHYPSDANFILMRSGINLYEKLKKQKILVRDCSNYKGLGEGYYRVCMRQRGDNQKLIDALGEILYAGQGEF